jgi:hypothetical protein
MLGSLAMSQCTERSVGREGAAEQATLMGALLTKRRAVDLCRVATCLCRFV